MLKHVEFFYPNRRNESAPFYLAGNVVAVGPRNGVALGDGDGPGHLDGVGAADLLVDGRALGAVASAGLSGPLAVAVTLTSALLQKQPRRD